MTREVGRGTKPKFRLIRPENGALTLPVSSINVSELGRNSPAPENPAFRDWFARDSPLQRRVRKPSVRARRVSVSDIPGAKPTSSECAISSSRLKSHLEANRRRPKDDGAHRFLDHGVRPRPIGAL